MGVRKRYDDFEEIYHRATDALYHRGKAETHGFMTTKEGTYLPKVLQGPNLRPDLRNGLPQEPSFRKSNTPQQGAYSTPSEDIENSRPSQRNTFKPRPPGF